MSGMFHLKDYSPYSYYPETMSNEIPYTELLLIISDKLYSYI